MEGYDRRGPALKPRRPFKIERGRLPARPGARTFLQLAAEPDRIAELHSLADDLQNIPREFVATKEDIFHFNRRVAGRIHKIADVIEVITPVATKKPSTAPKLARLAERPRRARPGASVDQLVMALV